MSVSRNQTIAYSPVRQIHDDMLWVIKHSRLQLSKKQCHAGFDC